MIEAIYISHGAWITVLGILVGFLLIVMIVHAVMIDQLRKELEELRENYKIMRHNQW